MNQGSYSVSDPEYFGINECKPGEITWEHLTNIMAHVRQCEKFNARFVTGRHLTREPSENV